MFVYLVPGGRGRGLPSLVQRVFSGGGALAARPSGGGARRILIGPARPATAARPMGTLRLPGIRARVARAAGERNTVESIDTINK